MPFLLPCPKSELLRIQIFLPLPLWLMQQIRLNLGTTGARNLLTPWSYLRLPFEILSLTRKQRRNIVNITKPLSLFSQGRRNAYPSFINMSSIPPSRSDRVARF